MKRPLAVGDRVALYVGDRECKHTPQPTGYIQWHHWVERMSKTHRQIQCPLCGLWAVWERVEAPRKKGDKA